MNAACASRRKGPRDRRSTTALRPTRCFAAICKETWNATRMVARARRPRASTAPRAPARGALAPPSSRTASPSATSASGVWSAPSRQTPEAALRCDRRRLPPTLLGAAVCRQSDNPLTASPYDGFAFCACEQRPGEIAALRCRSPRARDVSRLRRVPGEGGVPRQQHLPPRVPFVLQCQQTRRSMGRAGRAGRDEAAERVPEAAGLSRRLRRGRELRVEAAARGAVCALREVLTPSGESEMRGTCECVPAPRCAKCTLWTHFRTNGVSRTRRRKNLWIMLDAERLRRRGPRIRRAR